jgi:hypothetical protein
MPYDLHTPFGIMPGQVSPAEQLQAQTFQNARRRAADEDAQSAQLHALKQALGPGGGAARGGDEPDFSFAQGPKDTGAVDLGQRNAMVMRRQMEQADRDANAFRSTGLDAGTRERLAQGTARGIKNQQEEDDMLHPLIMQKFKEGMAGRNAGAAGAPPAGMNPNATTDGGINLGAMGGGASSPRGGAAGPGGMDLRSIAQLMALRKGLQMPDFDAQDAERDYTTKRNALDLRQREADLTDSLGRRSKEKATEAALAGDPTTVTSKYPELTTPLSQKVSEFVTQDTNVLGRDPTDADIDGLIQERDRAARGLAARGLSPQAAREEANRAIVNALGPNRNDSNNGWTQQLLVRLGIGGAPAAGAAQPDIDINAMNYGPG